MKKINIILTISLIAVWGFVAFLYFRPKPNVLSVKSFNEFPTEAPAKNKFPTGTVHIIAVGDIMLGRSVMAVSLAKNDPDYPFEKVADKLKGADITVGNLEAPIVSNCPISNEGFKFCADPKMLSGLSSSGFDIVNIANNHTKNYGEGGFRETKNYLKSVGIDYVGDQNMIIKNIEGVNFGFLGFDFVDKKISDTDLQIISDSKKKVDVLLAIVHWGNEYVSIPTQNQKEIAEKMVAMGTDVILGSHPHWIENIENVDGKPVFYSLGNFIFDQAFSDETKKGLAVNLNYSGKNLIQIDQMPIYMLSFAQPEWK